MRHIAAQPPRQQSGLGVGEESDGDAGLQHGVVDFLLLAVLPRGDDDFAAFVVEQHRAALALVKVLGLDLRPVDQGEGEPVGQRGAEFFHKVEGQRGTAGAYRVQEPKLGVQPDGFQRGAAIPCCQCVKEGEQGVESVARRAAVAGVKREVAANLRFHDHRQGGKVTGRRFPLQAAKLVKVGCQGDFAHLAGDMLGGLDEGFPAFWLVAFPCPAHQQLAAVAKLARGGGFGEFKAKRGVVGGAVLGLAQQDVAADRPFQPGTETARVGEPDDGLAVFGASPQQGGAEHDVIEQYEAANVVQRHLQALGVVHHDADGVALKPQIGIGGGDVEGVL